MRGAGGTDGGGGTFYLGLILRSLRGSTSRQSAMK